MDQQYSHLSVEERAVIMIERSKGVSLRAIGRTLERNVSTISREINRGIPDQAIASIGHAVAYDATVAAATYRERRRRCGRRSKLMEATPLFQKVYDRLVYWGWSPQQHVKRTVPKPSRATRTSISRQARSNQPPNALTPNALCLGTSVA